MNANRWDETLQSPITWPKKVCSGWLGVEKSFNGMTGPSFWKKINNSSKFRLSERNAENIALKGNDKSRDICAEKVASDCSTLCSVLSNICMFHHTALHSSLPEGCLCYILSLSLLFLAFERINSSSEFTHICKYASKNSLSSTICSCFGLVHRFGFFDKSLWCL